MFPRLLLLCRWIDIPEFIITLFIIISFCFSEVLISVFPKRYFCFSEVAIRNFQHGVTYQMNGIRRYFTFCLYSLYPISSFSRNSSSFLMRLAIINGYARKTMNEYREPRIRGIERNSSRVALYIGCLTMP